MSKAVEEATRDQSQSTLWYKYRAGRVTASRMKSVCHTKPAQSLIKCICYPEAFKFSSTATIWGCQHKKCARDTYKNQMVSKHSGFVVSNCGFVINPEWGYLGASPDGSVKFDCCTNGGEN